MSALETGREAARELVTSIAEDHGYVHEDDWKSMTPAVRERVQKAMRNLETIAGVAVATLAKNLYTSDARFVFELLQNAEDNSFEKAREANLTPYVSFEVHPDHIIIECNEDGFEPKNLKAICAVGQSSKSGVQKGYVGEKGIGFKSVFMAAWKVYIQSGHFNFFFQHKRGDQGLGMISPVWNEPESDLPHPGTRMKLLLGDGYKPIPSSQYQIILDQFNSLNESILIFMRNLGKISISIFDHKGNIERSNTFSKYRINANLVRLSKITKVAQTANTTSKDYYIFKHTVGNLDKNDNRTYSEYEEKTKAYASAEIVLGFPLTDESVPIVEHQETFAFLPMKQAGFTFLINSDFVTQASRQDIITTSGRNIGIRRGIADAFVQAILELCNHPKLQYTWMRYLPNKDQHYEPFWSQLVNLLDEKLKETAVLRPRSEKSFCLISSLRFLVDSQLDRHGEPLFKDNNLEIYISRNYTREDIKILRKYGLNKCTASEILLAISLDLNSSDPRMRSKDLDDDWHMRSANYLKYILAQDKMNRYALRSLRVLPLQDERWVAAENYDVFFPETHGLDIPPGLDLKVIDTKAAQNIHRRQLFRYLGVKEAEIPFLRQRILDRRFRTLFASATIQQLKYMFLTDKHKQSSEGSGNIWVTDSQNILKCPHSTDIYMSDDKPFGPSKLLEKAKDTDGISLNFLHPNYTDGAFEGDDASLIDSWKNWLCSYAGVRRHLRIISKENRRELSKECLHVARCQADKFLGFLNYTWSQESKDIESSSDLITRLNEIMVPCQDGQMVALGKTWLPLPDLQEHWKRFSRASEKFPFLKLDKEVTRDTYAKDWSFLTSSLSVRAVSGLSIYLEILLCIMSHHKNEELPDESRIFDLYTVIYAKYLESPPVKASIQDLFKKDKLIYIPKNKYSPSMHMSPNDCVWEGPEALSIKAPLRARYKAMPINKFSSIASFMTDLLRIRNCDEEIICDQLGNLRESGSRDFERIHSLYMALWQILKSKSAEARSLTKSKFIDTALIYTKSDNGWSKVSQCLWSSATTIRSKRVLESDYADMKTFFVGILGVETLNIGLIYNELSKLAESTTTIELVKEQLFAFRDHFRTISDYKNVKPDGMKKLKIFPVKQPGVQQNVQLCDGNAEFAIANTIPLKNAFQPKIKTLDFTFEEIHSLSHVIEWLGLQERYLSLLVTETSRIEDNDHVINFSLSGKINSRARALCRVAKHSKSPRWCTPESIYDLYEMLKQAKVFETDKISCVQIVQQDGIEYSHEISRSEFHLEESHSGLDIFVPQENESQEMCLAYALPARLFEWMTKSPSEKKSNATNGLDDSIVKDILNHDPRIYNKILFLKGIVNVDNIEDEDLSDVADPNLTGSARGAASDLRDSTELSSNMATPSTDISSPRMDFDQDELPLTVVHQHATATSSHFASSGSVNRPFIQQARTYALTENVESSVSRQRESVSNDLQYTGLLNHVVSSARRASFPAKGIFDLDALRISLPSASDSSSNTYGINNYEFNSARNFSQLERDRMIGAAGELYVFELLKACNPSLSNFDIDNWKSTIRDYAKQHPEYAAMQPWSGRETSDLVYHDSMGTFTKLLIDNCYFDVGTWEHRRPTYYFEVKTTTSSCDTRFFVSKNQYKMLHDNRGKEDSVYIIMRVFNVGNSNIGLRIYVDPAELEVREELLFTAETWSVVPSA